MNQSAGAQPSPLAPEEFEQRMSLTYLGLKLFLAVATAPYRRAFKLYTWQPLKEIRSADGDRGLLISLVKDWKTDKYTELQSVQVAVSITSLTLNYLAFICLYHLYWTSPLY